MNSKNQVATQPYVLPENETPNLDILSHGSSPVAIILAISIFVGAIAKLIEVLVPVMKNTK